MTLQQSQRLLGRTLVALARWRRSLWSVSGPEAKLLADKLDKEFLDVLPYVEFAEKKLNTETPKEKHHAKKQ